MIKPKKKLTFAGLVDSIKEVDLQLYLTYTQIVEAAPQLKIDGKTLIRYGEIQLREEDAELMASQNAIPSKQLLGGHPMTRLSRVWER